MSENFVPISEHNAFVWQLEQMDVDLGLRTPSFEDTLLICNRTRKHDALTQLSIMALKEGQGFVAKRVDGVGIQAQDMRDRGNLPPRSRKVFDQPVDVVPVTHDLEDDQWRVEVHPDNVVDIEGLRMLVWALSHYGLEKKYDLALQRHLQQELKTAAHG